MKILRWLRLREAKRERDMRQRYRNLIRVYRKIPGRQGEEGLRLTVILEYNRRRFNSDYPVGWMGALEKEHEIE